MLRQLDLGSRCERWRELELTDADAAGVAKMADKVGFMAVKAVGVKSPGANILKQEMLSVGGDAAVARGVINCSVDRTDVILMGTRKQMRALIRKLKPQPFGLRRMAGELKSLLDREKTVPVLAHAKGFLELAERPAVMGVINATPDSFSDGGDYFDREVALRSALAMVEDGADLLDIGGESTRPGADTVSLREELERVIPLVEELSSLTDAVISVDTYKSEVASKAVAAGAAVVNDITGLTGDPEMVRAVRDTGAGLIVMHMRGTPQTMQTDTGYRDLVGEVYCKLSESVELAEAAGVLPEKIGVDPGIGFGKSVDGNLTLLKRLREFAGLGKPVLVGASRKSFIGKTLGIEEPKCRLEGSLAAAAVGVMNGARIIRTHDVRETRRAVDMAFAVANVGEE